MKIKWDDLKVGMKVKVTIKPGLNTSGKVSHMIGEVVSLYGSKKWSD